MGFLYYLVQFTEIEGTFFDGRVYGIIFHLRYLELIPMAARKKNPQECPAGGKYSWQRVTLPLRAAAVPSPLEGLTTVFGMGTGGSLPLLPPGNL